MYAYEEIGCEIFLILPQPTVAQRQSCRKGKAWTLDSARHGTNEMCDLGQVTQIPYFFYVLYGFSAPPARIK